MQGFIATLLALMMTGMVVSKQPQSNNYQDRQTSDNTTLLSRYLLIMGDEEIRGLKTQGFLSAEISLEDQPTIDRVVFHSNELNARQSNLEPFEIKPIPLVDGEKNLEFELDDQDIEKLNRRGLIYIIGPRDRGRFNAVTVNYDRPLSQVNNRSVNMLQQRRSNERNFDQLAVDDQQQPFYGPQLPDDWRRQNRQLQNQQQNNSDSFRPQFGSIATRRNSTIIDDQNDRQYQQNNTRSRDISNRPLLPRQDNRVATIGDRREPSGTQSNPYRDFQNQNRRTDRVASNTPFQSSQLPQTKDFQTNTVDEFDPVVRQELSKRSAENRALDQINQNLADENEFLRRQAEEDRIAGMRAQSNRSDAGYTDRNGIQTNQFQADYSDDVIVGTMPARTQTSPARNRIALAPQPTSKTLPLSIAAPVTKASTTQNTPQIPLTVDQKILADAERFQKQNAALWFIMLCSVGINFYLSWIARGFYVRYEELADEIRESFTSSL